MAEPIRVLIVDDHALVRDGVRALLAAAGDVEVVGEAEDGHAAIREARRLDPDVILMDVAMPGLGGLEATLAIRAENTRARILVLTQYDDREYVGDRVEGFACEQRCGGGGGGEQGDDSHHSGGEPRR